jgi:hypothetical protein
MADNRIDSTSVAVSPTGTPVIPTSLTPWLAALVGIAAVLSQTLPPNTVASKVCGLLSGLGGLFGIGSAGWRKQP